MDDLVIRAGGDPDIPAIVALCRTALKWRAGDPNEALFRWKHVDNPFGRSYLWVAELDGSIVGVRPMMRWRFLGRDGTPVEAVRAVDTATHPQFQGRGIFSRLTRAAIETLTEAGVAFVFNTPNDQSRPGYLKLGWRELGRVPIAVRPTRWRRLPRLRNARVPADKWSEPPSVGRPVGDHLPATPGPPTRWRTAVDDDFVAWRYRLTELSYASLGAGGSEAVFRVRRRGGAVECALVDTFGDHPASAVSRLRRLVAADYLIATRSTPGTRTFVPLPRIGPRLVARELAGAPPALDEFDLRLADIELF